MQVALTKHGTVEFASLSERSFVRTQVEFKHGRVYMRAKKRTYVFT